MTKYPASFLRLRSYGLPLAYLFLSLAVACGDDEGGGALCDSTVARSGVLALAGSDASGNLDGSVLMSRTLLTDLTNFEAQPNESHLRNARASLLDARQRVAGLGPYQLILDPSGATLPAVTAFPVDTNSVNAAAEGGFDAESPADFDRGFAAIEFLLYGGGAQAAQRRLEDDIGRRSLALAYARDIEVRLASVRREWSNGGRETFAASTGTAAGEGISRLVNSLSKHFEDTRRDRLGTPFGVTLGFPTPSALEAPYSGKSNMLLASNIEASRAAYDRRSGGATLSAYLLGLQSAPATELDAEIIALYDGMQAALLAVPTSLGVAVESNRDAVQTAYNAISRQVVNLKTDLPSVACVSITYVDNPSDSD